MASSESSTGVQGDLGLLPPIKVPVLDVPPSDEEFVEKYLKPGRPVIIKNAFTHWPAAQKWNLQYLKEKVGQNSVHVRKNVHLEDYKVGKKYNIEQMPFSNYLDNLIEGRLKEARKYYLAVQNVKRTFPEISDDISPLPSYVGKVHMGPYMWIAAPGHFEFCHVDADDGLLFMITGRKTIKLYSWKHLHDLYPNPLGHKGRTIQSQVNCDMPDLEKFPNFRNAQCELAEIGPGDSLFIPAFYWHQVTSTEMCISVNVFFGDAGERDFVTKLIDTRWNALIHWILNIVQQNIDLPSWPTVLSILDTVIPKFLFKQYHDTISDEQNQKIVRAILDYCKISEIPREAASEAGKHTHLKIRGLLWRE